MKLTKYAHACFTLEHDGATIAVDPGGWSDDFKTPEHVIAVIVTHEHPDHCDTARLQAIVDKNPDAVILAHADVVQKLPDLPTRAVDAGEVVTLDPFTLEFFGGKHATIHADIGPFANLGVLINNTVYYPGDSFTKPSAVVKVLALPVTAPWLKIGEVIDFMLAIKPELVFPTHDAIASDTGKQLVDTALTNFAQPRGIVYQRIDGSTEV